MVIDKIYLNSVNSTQEYLVNYISKNGYKNPMMIIANEQTNGKGSRDNHWICEKGNLFFSFVVDTSYLPKDMKIESSSIYFSCLLNMVLEQNGSKSYIKWPNDFYINDDKIGGTMTYFKSKLLYCGIGLNIIKSNIGLKSLDIDMTQYQIIDQFIKILSKNHTWAFVFNKFMVKYNLLNENKKTTINNKQIKITQDMLQADGSLLINNKKEYSLR